jgi:hypothetical protein
MSQIITYNLPPYVELVNNPHYNGDISANIQLDSSSNISMFSASAISSAEPNNLYAPYKLKSLGNYPLGMYTISVPNEKYFSGTFEAVESTNSTVTLMYPDTLPNPYPRKTQNLFMDVNEYSFAYKKYPKSPKFGGFAPYEKFYDSLIYDYDAFPWNDSVSCFRHHFTKNIYYRGIVPGLYMYGYDQVHLPELPYNSLHDIPDPTGHGLIPYSERTSLEGRYFILIKKTLLSEKIDIEFYPPLPDVVDLQTWAEPIKGSKFHPINNINRGEGAKVSLLYDGFFWSSTGPSHSIVYPALRNKRNNTEPALISLPEGSNYGAFRFYLGRKRSKDFDLYRNLSISPIDTTLDNFIPTNISTI